MTKACEVQWDLGVEGWDAVEGRFSWGHLNLALEENEQEPRKLEEAEACCRGTEARLEGRLYLQVPTSQIGGPEVTGQMKQGALSWKTNFPPKDRILNEDTTDYILQALN